jgi:hypothetical protein
MNMIRSVRRRFTVGHLATATDPATLRRAAAELLATAIFVFAAEGAALTLGTHLLLRIKVAVCVLLSVSSLVRRN